jgi:hypothetical protein
MLNPLMLLGLLGLGLPVLIHMINRRRMAWRHLSTVQFLDQDDVANVFAPTPRDVWQLLLRLLLLAAFVLLMVRFTRPADTPSPRAMAIVIDNSLGMQREFVKGVTLFETMRRQAGELVDGMRDTDSASLVLVGDRVFADTGLTRDRAALRSAVDAAWVGSGGSRSLIPAVCRAVTELQGAPAPDRAVVVFSDWPRAELARAAVPADLQRILAAGRVRVFLVGEPLPKADNLAVERLTCQPSAVHVGAGGKVTAKIRSYADRESTFDLALAVGAGEGESRTVALAPGATAHMDLVHRFNLPADVGLATTARSGDPLPADDRCYIPMRTRQQRSVLFVVSQEYPAAEGVERGYTGADILGYAINPEAALGLVSGVHTSVRRITPAAFARTTLSSFAAIVIYGVDSLPEVRSAQDLRDYVQNGGGLWLIPDRRVTPLQFNATFGDLLGGAQLGVLREPATPVFVSRGEAGLGHPLLLPLVRGEWVNPDEIPVARHWLLQHPGTTRRVLATREGEPLAAVAELGRGRVFLQLFDCDVRSSAYPRGAAFLPMIQTILGHLAVGDEIPPPDVIRAGATCAMSLPGCRGIGGDAVAAGPATNSFPLDPEGWIRVRGLDIAGQYQITHPLRPAGRPRLLAVNPVTGESDLTPSDAADIARIFGERNVKRIAFDAVARQWFRSRENAGWWLALVLAALAVEAAAGAWFISRRKEARQ